MLKVVTNQNKTFSKLIYFWNEGNCFALMSFVVKARLKLYSISPKRAETFFVNPQSLNKSVKLIIKSRKLFDDPSESSFSEIIRKSLIKPIPIPKQSPKSHFIQKLPFFADPSTKRRWQALRRTIQIIERYTRIY